MPALHILVICSFVAVRVFRVFTIWRKSCTPHASRAIPDKLLSVSSSSNCKLCCREFAIDVAYLLLPWQVYILCGQNCLFAQMQSVDELSKLCSLNSNVGPATLPHIAKSGLHVRGKVSAFAQQFPMICGSKSRQTAVVQRIAAIFRKHQDSNIRQHMYFLSQYKFPAISTSCVGSWQQLCGLMTDNNLDLGHGMLIDNDWWPSPRSRMCGLCCRGRMWSWRCGECVAWQH